MYMCATNDLFILVYLIVVAIAKIEKVCRSIHGPLMGRADCILVKTGPAHRFLVTESLTLLRPYDRGRQGASPDTMTLKDDGVPQFHSRTSELVTRGVRILP